MKQPDTAAITLLAVDNVSLPLRRDLCLYLSKPKVRAEPVLLPERGNPDAPDNAAAHFYGGVVREHGKYRMWYYACHWEGEPNPTGNGPGGSLREGPTCYAESDDGLLWTKPHLGQVEWRGSRANNVIRLQTLHSEGVHVIKDEQDPDPARRYKMVYNEWIAERRFWTIRTAVSADGLIWTDGPRLPYDGFFEQACLYEFKGMYYVSGQMTQRSEGGHPTCRQGFAIVSPDFVHWLPEAGESFLLPEPQDPQARGAHKPYDQVHIGVGASSLGNVLVGLYCIWHNRSFPTPDDWFGHGTTTGDFGLVVSNDGLHFREPVKGHVWLHRDDSPPHGLRPGAPHGRILCQGNGIINVGDETRIYHGRWANAADLSDYHAEVALATLPRDRWGALGLFPDADTGSVWTAPVICPDGRGTLRLNADGVAGITVEAADARFGLIPSCAGSNAGVVKGADGLDCSVTWPNNALAALGGQSVRFRLTLTKSADLIPRLYAAYLG